MTKYRKKPSLTVDFVVLNEPSRTYTLHENYSLPASDGPQLSTTLGVWQFVLDDGRTVTLHAAHVLSLTYDNGSGPPT